MPNPFCPGKARSCLRVRHCRAPGTGFAGPRHKLDDPGNPCAAEQDMMARCSWMPGTRPGMTNHHRGARCVRALLPFPPSHEGDGAPEGANPNGTCPRLRTRRRLSARHMRISKLAERACYLRRFIGAGPCFPVRTSRSSRPAAGSATKSRSNRPEADSATPKSSASS